VAALLFAGSVQAQEALSVSGYFKSLLIGSRTLVPPQERYPLDLNRLRLELKGPIADKLSVDLQYDNELLLGDYLRTGEFRMIRDRDPPTYWRAQGNYLDNPGAYGLHRLHRASITASMGDTDVRVGRQRIAWGTGRFWSPLDILNPVSATALEREERVGVDALLVEHKLGAVSRAAFVYAPQHERRDRSFAAMWHDNRRGVDHSVVVGRFGRDNVAGLDLAGQIGDTGVRAELTRAWGPTGGVRVLVGADHAFANTLTLSGELFHDGAGARDRRHYAGVSARYDITPLWKTRHELVVNLDDRSRYYGPALTWSARDDIDLTVGAQLFGGRSGTELRRFPRVLHLQLQWFF
jgi:hypothetical protein